MFGLRQWMKNPGRQLFFWLLLSLCTVGPLDMRDTRYEPGLVEGPDLISRGVRASIQLFSADFPGVTVPSLQFSTLMSRHFRLGNIVL